jgi:hypothetical protein
LKVPSIKLGPKPKVWDLVALAVLVLAAIAGGAHWAMAQNQPPGASLAASTPTVFVQGQLALASLSLLMLGKTATEGTLWGNLAAVGGMFAGLGGVLLATALWIAA